MKRAVLFASLLFVSSPVMARDTWSEFNRRLERESVQEQTNKALNDIADQIRQLRIQQQSDEPLINDGR